MLKRGEEVLIFFKDDMEEGGISVAGDGWETNSMWEGNGGL